MQNTKFSELPVSEEILRAVEELGFENTTPIQAEAIPVIMTGKDVLGQAQTGTGKTAAFGIPAIEKVDVSIKSTQVLILCPTRELALQVKEQIQKLAKHKRGLLVAAIYGGESYERQFKNLEKGAQIVVGTPGRIMDHLERRTLRLDDLNLAILDEADEMLNMGFRDDIEKILSQAPQERQTLLFSATMSPEILSIAKRFQKSPEIVKVTRKEISNANIEQLYYTIRKEAKVEVMSRLIDVHDLKLILVFCNMKSKVDEVVNELQIRGYAAEGLHGDMRQMARNQVMSKFRAGTTTILVATDVAARGIDVSGVDAVFNFDLPQDLEYYVHRIGRTGRAGRLGKAFSFISGREKYRLRDVESYTKVKITEGEVPTLDVLLKSRNQRFIEQIKANISDDSTALYEEIVDKLKEEGYYTHQILPALMRMQLGNFQPAMNDSDLVESRGGDRRGGRDDRRGGDRRDGGRDGGRSGGREFRREPREFVSNPNARKFETKSRDAAPRREPREGGRGNVGTAEAGMVRLFINLGRKDNVSPNHIVGAIASEAQIPGRAIGSIDVYDKFSFVEVPERDANRVLEGMKGKTINSREASIEIAK